MKTQTQTPDSADRAVSRNLLPPVLGRGLALMSLFVTGFLRDRKGHLLIFMGLLPVALIIVSGITPTAFYLSRIVYVDLIRIVYGTLLVPLFGLLLGTAAVSEEIESHTIVQIVSRPVRRIEILIWRYIATVVAGSIAAFVATGAMYLWFTIVAGIEIGFLLGSWAFLTVCSAVYCGIFILLGIALKKPLFWGVLVVLYEQLLGAVFSFIGGLPYSLSAHMSNMGNIFLEFNYTIPSWTPTSSAVVLLSILAISLVLAAFLFQRKDLS